MSPQSLSPLKQQSLVEPSVDHFSTQYSQHRHTNCSLFNQQWDSVDRSDFDEGSVMAELSLRRNRAEIYSSQRQNKLENLHEKTKRINVAQKIKFGRHYKTRRQQLEEYQTVSSESAVIEWPTHEKRFSITRCLNNPRQYPVNVLSPLSAQQADVIAVTSAQHGMRQISALMKPEDDTRVMWHSGQAQTHLDRSTVNDWPFYRKKFPELPLP